MSLTSEVALFALRSFPVSIQHRLLQDPGFQQTIGLNGLVAPWDGVGRIRLGDLLDAARLVYEKNEPCKISNLDEKEIIISLREGRVVAIEAGEKDEAGRTHVDLMLVSPNVELRLEALQIIQQEFGPTGPDPTYWGGLVKERPLTNDEIAALHDEMTSSHPYWLRTVKGKIDSGNLTPADLVPLEAGYFVKLCGPLPEISDADSYLDGPLQKHRRLLLDRDLTAGLLLCLPGVLRFDMSLVPLLKSLGDEEIWKQINGFSLLSDPFSLVGIVQIALSRRKSWPAFNEIAANLIEKLCGDALQRHDGIDVYTYFPSLVSISLRNLRHLDGMATQPSFWQWFCAFTHAGVLTQLLDKLNFEPDKIVGWLDEDRTSRDSVADILSIRNQPTWRFDYLTKKHLQAEILGQLKGLAQHEERLGNQIPHAELLDEAINRLGSHGFYCYRSGPLEGHLRPKSNSAERTLPKKEAEELLSILEDSEEEFPWAGLDNICAFATLPDDLRQAITNKIPGLVLTGEDISQQTNSLSYIALVAAVHEDEEMAAAVVERAYQVPIDNQSVQMIFFLILIASAAIPGEHWVPWLSERLFRLAASVPMGEPAIMLSRLLGDLKMNLPINQWQFGRAEAMCAVACNDRYHD